MSAKAPIYLKRRSRKGKKEKLRDLLSSDMISPPLGDFRHTIHIGSGGGADDLFGDLSFLQGKFHLLPGQQGRHALSQYAAGGSGDDFQFSRTSSVSGHLPSSESSPLLKNALSLPVIGSVQALTLPSTISAAPQLPPSPPRTTAPRSPPPPPNQAPPPKPPRLHLEDRALTSSPPPRPTLASPERTTTTTTTSSSRFSPTRSIDDDSFPGTPEEDTGLQERPYLSHAGSLLSLHLDLGPSILDEVLQIMDSQHLGGLNGGCMSGGRQEIYT
ncbi:cdc42 effector protein 2 [Sardina pilchardus]|uniref:cdc42 effector protein 2 n=1 Tax=Sardina pilchardus TaxID=27697 RepID=UPI002E0E7915